MPQALPLDIILPRWPIFVSLKASESVSGDEVIGYCRDHLARFKVPKNVVFTELPKTSTGKVQKFALREMAEAL